MYRVTADVEYVDGFLKGFAIPAGHSYTVPDQETAISRVAALFQAERMEQCFHAAVTGNKYRVFNPRVERVQA